ncbi:hypothetical protein C0995_012596 [Termitomyces sp. Mi166|nr:hypothetical protein C0995_012596 [Termitomyces sp. Mi166\
MGTGQPLSAAFRLKIGHPNIQQGALVPKYFHIYDERDYFLDKDRSQDSLMQHLEFEDHRMNEMILRRAQGQPVNFVSLANDNVAQNLLESMTQHSERIRRTRAQQRPADTPSSDVQRLRNEVEDLRRENEIYRSLARQTPQTPQLIDDAEAQRLRDEIDNLRRENERLKIQLVTSHPPPEYAPPPYIRSN